MAGKNTMLEIGSLIVPVKLDKISVRSEVKIDRASPNGNKLKRVEIDSVTGETVEYHDVKRGVFDNPRDGSGFREIPQHALDAIEIETEIDSFVVEHFIPINDLPMERVSDAYYLTPQAGVSGKPLKLLHEALRRSKKAGVFKLQLTKRQYLAAIYAHNGALIVNLLYFASDFKKAKHAGDSLADVEVKPDQVKLATQLIEAYTADASVIDTFEDDLISLKRDLLDQALAGKTLTSTKKPAPKVEQDDLAAQLAASVEAAEKKRKGKTAATV